MALRIAVAVGENGTTTSLYEAGTIVIYQKSLGKWQALQQAAYDLEQAKGLRHMRAQVEELVRQLREYSDVFVGLTVTGLPYYELEKAGFSVWEFEGKPEEFLDYILEKEEEAQLESEQSKPVVIPVPEEKAPGEFFISIKEVQENNAGLTTKQVLQPFIRKKEFQKLEILCNHIPPWLEAEAAEGKVVYSVEKLSSKDVKVCIARK